MATVELGFSEDQRGLFKAFVDPDRLNILTLLEQGPCTAKEIAAKVRVRQTTVSRHLAILVETDVVTVTQQGEVTSYSLVPLYEERAEFFKIFIDPTRLRILSMLEAGACSVSQIANQLGIRLPKASQHLALMRKAGVVAGRRDGSSVWYSLAFPEIRLACRIIHEVVVKRANSIGRSMKSELPL